jgi:hypothetical protein
MWIETHTALLLAFMTVLIVGLAGLIVWLAIRLRRVENSYRALTSGTDAGSLEAVLQAHVSEVRQAVERVGQLDERTRQMERASRSYIQRLGVLRFNPFRDSGGDQSFVVALTDQYGNGVVISGLHGRDATRVYAKPLAGWESAYPLTDEERQAIRKAKGEAATP